MAKYAKYIDENTIRYAQRTLKEPEFICFNFSSASPEILNSRGYYEVIEDEQPECEEGYYLKPQYELVSQYHTEEIEVPVTDEGDYETQELKTITIDDSYIAVHWTVAEIQEEQE